MFIIFLKKKNLVYKVTKLLYLEIENSCLKGKSDCPAIRLLH